MSRTIPVLPLDFPVPAQPLHLSPQWNSTFHNVSIYLPALDVSIALNIFYFHTTQPPDTSPLLYLVFKYPKLEEKLAVLILLKDDIVTQCRYTLGDFQG